MSTTKIKANIIRRIALKGIKICRSRQKIYNVYESDSLEAAIEKVLLNILYKELFCNGERFFQSMNLLGKHLRFMAKYDIEF